MKRERFVPFNSRQNISKDLINQVHWSIQDYIMQNLTMKILGWNRLRVEILEGVLSQAPVSEPISLGDKAL